MIMNHRSSWASPLLRLATFQLKSHSRADHVLLPIFPVCSWLLPSAGTNQQLRAAEVRKSLASLAAIRQTPTTRSCSSANIKGPKTRAITQSRQPRAAHDSAVLTALTISLLLTGLLAASLPSIGCSNILTHAMSRCRGRGAPIEPTHHPYFTPTSCCLVSVE